LTHFVHRSVVHNLQIDASVFILFQIHYFTNWLRDHSNKTFQYRGCVFGSKSVWLKAAVGFKYYKFEEIIFNRNINVWKMPKSVNYNLSGSFSLFQMFFIWKYCQTFEEKKLLSNKIKAQQSYFHCKCLKLKICKSLFPFKSFIERAFFVVFFRSIVSH